MIDFFSLDAVSKSASAFNTEKLLWLNHHYINHLDADYVAQHLVWHMNQHGYDLSQGPDLITIIKLFGERCKTLKEMAQSCAYCYQDFSDFDADAAKKHLRPVAKEPLENIRAKIEAIADFDWEIHKIHEVIEATAAELEIGMGKIGMPLRVAVTGIGQSPSVDATVFAVGKKRTLARIDKALAYINQREQTSA